MEVKKIFLKKIIVSLFIVFFVFNFFPKTALAEDTHNKAYYDAQFNNFSPGGDYDFTIQLHGDIKPPTITIGGRPDGWEGYAGRPEYTFTLKEYNSDGWDTYYYFECSHIDGKEGGCERIAIQVNEGAFGVRDDIGKNTGNAIWGLYKSDPEKPWYDTNAKLEGQFYMSDVDNLKAFLKWAQDNKDKLNDLGIQEKGEKAYGGPMGWITKQIENVFSNLIDGLSTWINEALLSIGDLRQETNVVEGWARVRDASNIMLVLGLLLIAGFNAVRFQIEYYTAKILIPRLVIAAIFINFSFLLTQVIYNLVDILTIFFTRGTNFANIFSAGGGAAVGTTGVAAGIYALASSALGVPMVWGAFATIVLIIVLLAIITVVAILIMRKAILYILIVFSPLVFLFSVLPFTRGLTSTWWNYLTRWAFMGPVAAIILFVASKL